MLKNKVLILFCKQKSFFISLLWCVFAKAFVYKRKENFLKTAFFDGHLELQSVSGPGTPWIPDPSDPDPTNPTPPGTDDDEADAYISVKITINPWTYWTQGVDLH